jgi:hypothetical protein
MGGGPQLSIGRDGAHFGLQGGVGVASSTSDSSGTLRADLGFVTGKRGHGFAGLTLALNKHEGPDGHVGYGAALSAGAGVGNGLFLAAGAQGGFYELQRCQDGGGWMVLIGARIVGEDRQFLVWPQYQRWTPDCFIID